MDKATPILSFKDVSFRYERNDSPVVDNVSFELAPRSFTTVVGPSGGGKSTILQLAAGLVKPFKGSITNNARTRMIFQNGGLLPWRTVYENVMLGFTGLKVPPHERDKRLRKELDNLGLAEWANSYPRDLSGGQRQRVGIARALVSDPELLLLDEPFSALDVDTTQRLLEELRQIFANRSVTMLMVSHNIEDAVALADRVFIYSHHKIAHVLPVPIINPHHVGELKFEHTVREIKKLLPKE